MDQDNIEAIAKKYSSYRGLNGFMNLCLFNIFRPHIKSPLLEIGAADGYMTELISKEIKPKEYHIVEASQHYCNILKEKYPLINVHHNFMENFKCNSRFNCIIASHVLEHIKSPKAFLASVKQCLSNNGKLLISVPNALSIHRLVGVEMGLIDKPDSLNSQDESIGHYRVYSPIKLEKEISSAGFSIQRLSTSFIKETSIPLFTNNSGPVMTSLE